MLYIAAATATANRHRHRPLHFLHVILSAMFFILQNSREISPVF
jgi:hypothetical protein